MDRKKAEQVWQNYRSGQATEDERALVESWLLHNMEANGDIPTETDLANAAERFEKSLPLHRRSITLQPKFGKRNWRIAASIALFLGIGLAAWYGYELTSRQHPHLATVPIQPGKDKAILTLEDGRKIALDEVTSEDLAASTGLNITKSGDGSVVYQPGNAPSEPRYHTLTTPLGGQYQVVLPDGSKVWLNAGSSIRYPIAFSANSREVVVTGESYFEVKKQHDKPFIVHTGEMSIQVLGTSFDVSAYADETSIRTTLVSGSIRVAIDGEPNPGGNVLQPGQQLVLANGIPEIRSVNTADVIAWKNGYFVFDHADVDDVLRQLARWYDVQVENDGNLTGFEFSGEIPRSSSLEDVIRILEIEGVYASINGRTVKVSGKK